MKQVEESLISVIIPAFNYAHYLPQSIGSIISQTYTNWECIIVDDGSTDSTATVMKELQSHDNRIKYVQQKNAGPTVARNYGVKLAKGSYIQFLDADDLLENLKFEKQLVVFANNAGADIVYGSAKYFENDKPNDLFFDIDLKATKTWMPNISGSGELLIESLLKSNMMVISSPLIKKELFDKYGAMDETLFFNEDWELWLNFAVNGANFLYHEEDKTSVLVRVHSSYSKDNFKMFVFGLRVCQKYLAILPQCKYKKILRPKINYHTKTIDQKITAILKSDKKKAIEMCNFVYQQTNIARYSFYHSVFKNFPYSISKLISLTLASISKLKSLIVYGA